MTPTLRLIRMGMLTLGLTVSAHAATYYVSSATGNDADDGLTPQNAFASISHVNSLALQPGDEVRLLCGETWRTDPLIITRSGSAGVPIIYSSHPAGCNDKPVLSGAQPISGWAIASPNVYVADLAAGANAGRFPLGLNQLFRGGGRLPMGRWPNIEGHPDGGYAEVDSQPLATRISDAELPAVDWTGAVMHIKGIRWYMLNRVVSQSVGSTLYFTENVECWAGDCTGWGYFLNSHLATLDREGEWFYDEATRRVYLYSAGPAPTDGEVEGSAILAGNGIFWGGVVLGRHLQEHIAWVTIENLRVERWYQNGITTPENLEADENHDLVIRNNEVLDVDSTGLRLTTWVWNAAAHGNGPSNWRGGRNLLIEGNVIDGANHFGFDFYGVASEVRSNTIRNVALIPNLARSGMGCGFSGTNCTENGAGIRLNHSSGAPDHTARDNVLRYNRIERVGMNGIDVFGRNMTIENNVVDEACSSKGDCGAIRTFGRTSLAATPVFNVVIRGNVIRDVPGNTDGNETYFETPFGFGIYVDNFSRDITVEGNTVIGATWNGGVVQQSTAVLNGNTFYDNVSSNWGSQLRLMGSVTSVSQSGNVFFSLAANRRTFQLPQRSHLSASDGNYFFNPYDPVGSIHDESTGGVARTLSGWQSWSGLDGSSATHWYTLAAGATPRSQILVNDTGSQQVVPLLGGFSDLDQQALGPSVTLLPYSSRVVVGGPESIFTDNFESGNTTRW